MHDVKNWVCAGVLTAGLSSAMLAGAALAAAAPDGDAHPPSGSGSSPSTDDAKQTAKPPRSKEAADNSGSSGPRRGTQQQGDRKSPTLKQTNQPIGISPGNDLDQARPPRQRNTLSASVFDRKNADTPAAATSDPIKKPDLAFSTTALGTVTDTAAFVPVQHLTSASAPDLKAANLPQKPDPIESVAVATSAMVSGLFSPHFAVPGLPDAPGSLPQPWALAAAARRELDMSADEATPAAMKNALAPSVQNSLTYTPGPSLFDQITLTVLDGFKVFSKVTGINLTAVIGAVTSFQDPPFFLTFGLNTKQSTFVAADGAQWQVWEISPPNPSDKTVVAFHGGGWIFQTNLLNWIDYTSMARETGATVVVPLYPLATTEAGAAVKVVPEAADFLFQQITVHGAENVSIYADSAGSSMALAAVRKLILDGADETALPASMVLLSSAMDMSNSNPDIRNVDDPYFDLDNLSAWESHWTDGVGLQDPLVSPLFFEDDVLKKLPPTTIYVGQREILYPDTLVFHQRAVDLGAPISVVVGTGIPHDWPASGLPIYSQAPVVRPDIYRELGLIDSDEA
ncbi:MAG: triacylglycerol lipase [Mycobacterium sp.]|nr:triacylglycerol lipase [Mycobacterium sp.]